MSSTADFEYKERLIRNVKKEVKQIMEEAVTRKFVHEDSGSITSLCGAVEACLSQGLRRRALGLFKTSSTTALLHKVAKNFEPAAIISQKVIQIENQEPNRRSSSSGESFQRPPKPPLQKKNSSTGAITASSAPVVGQLPPRYLWIRLALFDKQLAKIIGHLAENSNKYYEKDALISDPDYGSILSSLLVGPCALDYSKSKRQEQFWTDPPADELVQRHRISQGNRNTPPAARRHNGPFNSRRSLQGVSAEESLRSGGTSNTAKDYVESLHQNSRATLLYGKNNVHVLPKDHTEPMPGYLSLHQCNQSLTIKWTPNQLMNGYGGDAEDDLQDKRRGSDPGQSITSMPYSRFHLRRPSTKAQLFMYWEYAMNVQLDDIVYVHCHQQGGDSSDSGGGTVILVGQDGVQRPPIHFPKGGHLLAFLGCLENGLMPHGQLDPPLWTQRGKGKVFPKLKRRGKGQQQHLSSSDYESSDSTDYVFRILNKATRQEYMSSQEYLDTLHLVNQQSPCGQGGSGRPKTRRGFLISSSTTGSSTSSSKSLSLHESTLENPSTPPPTTTTPSSNILNIKKIDKAEQLTAGDSIELVCATMKRQIISRAFYGWLAYCRHLSTVRTHLSGLVYHRGNPNLFMQSENSGSNGFWKQEASDTFSKGLTEERWLELKQADPSGRLGAQEEIFASTYFGGVAQNIRKEAWPYLLGHYSFESTLAERESLDAATRQLYETTMSEWLAVEAIVRQRDKETQEASHAKLSSESCTSEPAGQNNLVNITRELSNDVFEDAASVLCSDEDEDSDDDDMDDVDQNLIVEEEDGLQTEEDKDAAVKAAANELLCTDNNASTSNSSRRCTLGSEGPKCPPNSIDRENKSSSSPDEGVDIDGENIQDKKEDIINKNVSDNDQSNVDGSSSVIINHTNPSVDSGHLSETGNNQSDNLSGKGEMLSSAPPEGISNPSRSNCVSPASSQGGVYSMELLENFGLNLHRIDKDVQRCDRNYHYFTPENLDKVRNIMCTYVWQHLDLGYMQGMCDLVAPLLVILDDEARTYACFCRLMQRMVDNFPNGGAMDNHFANMRSLIQILDAEMFELMVQNGDYTHFYFCYRWFLLDFKRELLYDDVFSVWETIWAARNISSAHFVLFIALALVESYRDIILSNSMDFTDIIKFFNEMAERHDAKAILNLSRELVFQLQTLIENK